MTEKENETAQCFVCKKQGKEFYIYDEKTRKFDSRFVACDRCAMKTFYFCKHCHRPLRIVHSRFSIGKEVVCDLCASEMYFLCEKCDRYTLNEEKTGDRLCNDCRSGVHAKEPEPVFFIHVDGYFDRFIVRDRHPKDREANEFFSENPRSMRRWHDGRL